MAVAPGIVKIKGSRWKHRLLLRLARSRDFPSRIRIFHFLKKLLGLELLLAETPSGVKLLLDLDDWVQYQVYFYGNYEPRSIRLFKELSESAGCILDVGSHIGQYILECAHADTDKKKKLVAIEVNPKTFTFLLNNIQLNEFDQVIPVLGAISGSTGLLNISMPTYGNMGNTQVSEETTGLNSYLSASFSPADLLARLAAHPIDLVKIDLEGHELQVIRSLFQQNSYPENIIFEYIPGAFGQLPELLELFRSHGYILKDVEGREYTGNPDVPEQNLWAQRTVL